MDKEILPIFFAVDNCYIPFLGVTLKSLIEHLSEKYYYMIKVLNTNVTEDNKKKISKFERKNVSIEFVDLNYYIDEVKDKLHTRDYYSKTTYFRLFIPELYPQYDKALYLDSDIIVLEDVANLFHIDIENNLIGAVPDGIVEHAKGFQDYVEKVVGVASYKNYFNAGVILMNLDELRKFDFKDKFIYLLSTIKYSVAQDQDYLNRICKGRVKIIDDSWNIMPTTVDSVENSISPKLIHFNLVYKPWHSDEIMYKEYFWKYAKKTEFFKEIQKIKDNYTEEKRFADLEGNKNLLNLAIKEANCVGDDRKK